MTDRTIVVAREDARFVLEWLKQSNAPANIIALQERAYTVLRLVPDPEPSV